MAEVESRQFTVESKSEIKNGKNLTQRAPRTHRGAQRKTKRRRKEKR
jgi:hypothetical protein